MSRVLEVPLLEADSFLTIDVATDLPEDPSEICQLLAEEESATKWWLAIAAAYADKGNLAAALDVATTGLRESRVLTSDEDRAPFWAMLSWLYIQKMRESPTAAKKEQFEQALEFGNKSFEGYQSTMSGNASISSVPAVLAQAALVSAVGNFNDALQPFQTVLAAQPDNVFAKMGRARVLYYRKNYRGALRLYQECLRQLGNTNNPVLKYADQWAMDPRLGIGLCFWHLQDRIKARMAWERVVSRPNSNQRAVAKAHAMLGAWFMDASLNGVRHEFEQNYRAAIDHFQLAYKQGEIALPALKLASYLFSKHDMVKVAKLTDRVLEVASMPELLAEALFWKARAAHYANDLTTALTLYTQAMAADDGNVAAAIGKGIVELAQQREAEAMLTFELIVQKFPKNCDALFYAGVFGALQNSLNLPNSSTLGKSRELLEMFLTVSKSTNRSPRPEALVLLSELLEKTNPVKAYEYLEQAVELLRLQNPVEGDKNEAVPLPVRINLGVLAFNLQKYEESEKVFAQAAASLSDSTTVYKPVIDFNLARVRETMGQDSSSVYTELRTVDAKARLLLGAALAPSAKTTEPSDLGDQIRALVDSTPNNLEVRSLYMWYLRHILARTTSTSSSEQREQARKAAELETEFVKATLSNVDKHDSYALVAMGNIYLSNAQQQPKHELAKKQRSYMRAGEFFEKALQIDKNNAYAAQGVAIALAETKRSEIAVPLFERIRESLRTTSVQSYINSGHALMESGDYVKASEIYSQALTLFDKSMPETDAVLVNRSEVLSFLARAWLARESRRKEGARAVEYAKLALEAQPDSPSLAFNLAYVQLQFADGLYRRPAEQRQLSMLELAKPWLESAIAELKSLIEKPEGSVLPFRTSDLEEKLDHAESTLLPQLSQAIVEQREYDQKAEAKREEAKRLREEGHRRRLEEQRKLTEEREQREARLAEERQRLQAQAAEWEAEREALREAMAQQNEEQSAKRSGKSKRKGKRTDDDDLIDDTEVPQLPSDSESSEDEAPQKIDRKQAIMDDSGDEEDAQNDEDKNNNDGDDTGANGEENEDGKKDDEDLDDLF